MLNYIETKRNLTNPQQNLVNAIRARLREINAEYKFTDNNMLTDSDLDQK